MTIGQEKKGEKIKKASQDQYLRSTMVSAMKEQVKSIKNSELYLTHLAQNQ
jgi:hypothetical protein